MNFHLHNQRHSNIHINSIKIPTVYFKTRTSPSEHSIRKQKSRKNTSCKRNADSNTTRLEEHRQDSILMKESEKHRKRTQNQQGHARRSRDEGYRDLGLDLGGKKEGGGASFRRREGGRKKRDLKAGRGDLEGEEGKKREGLGKEESQRAEANGRRWPPMR